MDDREKITAAGNTFVPVVNTLRSLGYSVRREGTDPEIWWAENAELSVSAEDPHHLLALVTMRQVQGTDWQASDREIEATLREFYGDEHTGA